MLRLKILGINFVEGAVINERIEVVNKGRAWEGAVGNGVDAGFWVVVVRNKATCGGKFPEHSQLANRAVAFAVFIG